MSPQSFTSSDVQQKSINSPNEKQKRISMKNREKNSLLVTVLKRNFIKDYKRIKEEKNQRKNQEKEQRKIEERKARKLIFVVRRSKSLNLSSRLDRLNVKMI
jgi:hypothetical protein